MTLESELIAKKVEQNLSERKQRKKEMNDTNTRNI